MTGVHPRREPAVRRGAVLESVQQEPELLTNLLGVESDGLAVFRNGIIKAATQCGDDLVHQYMAREG